MAAGLWLCEAPINDYLNDLNQEGAYWDAIWANFLAEFGGTAAFDNPIFTIKLAQRIVKKYAFMPLRGKITAIQKTFSYEFPDDFHYVSKPDLVEESLETFIHATWDIKLKTFTQRFKGDRSEERRVGKECRL